ncbi:MAG: DUF1080 domain-containing protein [Bacteroidetes bacterium]|nr:DUF1080 domain-containing protein [Bacteroidota bacterium]
MNSLVVFYFLAAFFQKNCSEFLPPTSNIGVGASKVVGAKMYFDGDPKCLKKYWKYWEGPRLSAQMPVKWPLVKDPDGSPGAVMSSKDPDPNALKGLYGSADLVTKDVFRDFRAHVEFLVRKPGGNSGVYLQNRYEIQILDGDSTTHGMAAIINEQAAPYFIYNGIGKWNAYDINFRAARFKDGNLVEQPRVTIYFNGTKIHQDEEIQQVWGGINSGIDGGNNGGKGITDKPGGLKLQSEGHEVLYRNIWIKKMNFKFPSTDF